MSQRQTVRKRRATTDELDLRYVLLRFADGAVIDPRRCPEGIQARYHWTVAGEPDPTTGANTICKHVAPKEDP